LGLSIGTPAAPQLQEYNQFVGRIDQATTKWRQKNNGKVNLRGIGGGIEERVAAWRNVAKTTTVNIRRRPHHPGSKLVRVCKDKLFC
jgi:hypothetical protein